MKRLKIFLIAMLLPAVLICVACGPVSSKINITFNYNYNGAPPNYVVSVDADTHVTEPEDPERENWRFLGWFTDADAKTPADFGRVVSKDTTFYAGWVQTGFTVTYNPNYTGANVTTATVTLGTKPTQPQDPERVGWLFVGWFTEQSCETQYLFISNISADITLYAGWEEVSVSDTCNIEFLNNYGNGGNYYTTKIIKGRRAQQPAAPERNGYAFMGWFIDSDCTTAYDFSSYVNNDLTLYAHWLKIWTFEAEYTNVDGIEGKGYSGEKEGVDIIDPDDYGIGASNGYYVGYLYNIGLTVTFEITAAEAVENAVLVLRLSMEQVDRTLTDEMYLIKVNNEKVSYESMVFTGVTSTQFLKLPFENYKITMTLNLKKGVNTITLTTNNSVPMIGTMYASAPMVDCLYIYTETALTWSPLVSNLDGK